MKRYAHKHLDDHKYLTKLKSTSLNLQTRSFGLSLSHLSETNDAPKNAAKNEGSLPTKLTPSQNLLNRLLANPHSNFGRSPSSPRKRVLASKSLSIQAKLNIGSPNDRHEQEADDNAAKVVRHINGGSQDRSVQRSEASESEDEELPMKPQVSKIQKQESMGEEDEELQMKSLNQEHKHLDKIADDDASPDLESSIQRSRGNGKPLDRILQRKIEGAMQADFSGVRIHTDSLADQLNQSIQAKAFTTGQDVFFRKGAYNPSSQDGQELIAHELTHVIQQSGTQKNNQTSQVNGSGNQSIQRKINFKPEKLAGMVSTKAKIASTFTEEGLSTLQRIKLVLKKYWTVDDPKIEANMLNFLEAQAELWLAQHKYTKTKKGRQKTALMNELVQSIITEREAIIQSDNYMKDLREDKFKFLTKGGKDMVSDDLSAPAIASTVKQNGLLEGEVRAIRMYTGDEFHYMNPILAKNEAWLNDQMTKLLPNYAGIGGELPDFLKGRKNLYDFNDDERARLNEEANTHSNMAIAGLKKLPDVVYQGFRGMGLSEAEYKAQYEGKVGQTISFPSFTSTSKKKSIAERFANMNSKPQGRVGILLTMNIKFGKDINKISGTGTSEAEILLLPNAQFKIDSIEDSVNGYKKVVLTQVA